MKITRPVTALVLSLFLGAAFARADMEPGSPMPDDPVGRHLFPPDRIMSHAEEIGLEDAQRSAIRTEVVKAQPRFTELQLDLQSEMEKLGRVLADKRVEEGKALGQLDRVLALEREIKRAQIGLLVRIKNTLTPQQQDKLAGMARGGR